MKNKNNTKKSKTVQGKFLLSVIPIIIIGMIMLMALSLKIMQVSTMSTLETSMHETATAAATMMKIQMDGAFSLQHNKVNF